MSDFEYDLFLSHASEDKEWCERLAEALRNRSVRVWFDAWELQPGDNLSARINDGIKRSRKMVAVFSKSYFKDTKVWTRAESYAQLSPDILSKDRPLIPLLIEDCEVEPTLRGILHLDFRTESDFELRLRQLIQALDLPRREFAREDEFEFREHRLDPVERSRRRGRRFADEAAALYRLLGWDAKPDAEAGGEPAELLLEKREGGSSFQMIGKCFDKRVAVDDLGEFLRQQGRARKKLPRARWIAVSSQGFDAKAREELDGEGIDCVTLAELRRDLAPLDEYARVLIEEYDRWREENWQGRDWFIRPEVRRDGSGEDQPALRYIADWLGNSNQNQLVLLGDAGSGKSTLVRFLVDDLARRYLEDPTRNPAPVLIPLGEVRKETTLEAIVHEHFRRRNLPLPNYRRFEHLVRQGEILLFFDAFDEMIDRVTFDEGFQNFREISRAAEGEGKVIVTCRVNYFKDFDEQKEIITDAYRAAGTEYYKELRRRQGNEVVYLMPFDEARIREYLRLVRPTPDEDWKKIEQIYDLKGLAQLPLLMDMIIKSLDKFESGERVDAAKLYERYTEDWLARENKIGVKFTMRRADKLHLMQETAWRLWNQPDRKMRYSELVDFVEEMRAEGVRNLRGHETEHIASAMHLRSFLRREGESAFTFIHRSFQEYFLARLLHAGLTGEGDAAALLDARRFNKRIIHFLTMMDAEDRIVPRLQSILAAGYRANVSENALEMLYWGGRIRCEMEEEVRDIGQLRAALSQRMLRAAQLVRAQLSGATLECADLTDADLSEADLTGTKLNDASLDRARLAGANLCGASLLGAKLADADFTDAQYDAESFQGAETAGAKGLVGVRASVEIARLRPVVQLGASDRIQAVAYSPNGELIATGGDDGVVRLYRASDGALLCALESHGGGVQALTFSPDGEWLASGSNDHRVKLWEKGTSLLARTLEGHVGRVTAVTFSPDGQWLASGSYDDTVKLWERSSGRLKRTLKGHEDIVTAVAFSPDGEWLVSGSNDHRVKLWERSSGRLKQTLESHGDRVTSVAFSPDGDWLVSGSYDDTVKLWERSSGRLERTLKGHGDRVTAVTFSPDGDWLASGSWDHTVKLWERSSGRLERTLEGHGDSVNSVTFSPDGDWVASGSSDKTVKLWERSSGRLMRTLEGHGDRGNAVTFSPDGEWVVSGSSDRTVKLWEMSNGRLARTLEGHEHSVNAVRFSPDGDWMVSGSSDKTVKLWERSSGRLGRTLEGHGHRVNAVTFSPDGDWMASGSSDRTVKLWERSSGRLKRTLEGHRGYVRAVTFSSDGEWLASGSDDKTVKLWERSSGRLKRTLKGHGHRVTAVTFSPDGDWMASGSDDKTVKLWERSSGQLARTLEGHGNIVNAVTFSLNGDWMASGSDDNTVKLWERRSGRLLRTFAGTMGPISGVGFAPKGGVLVAAGAAGRLQFWDRETGETILYLYGFGAGAWLALLPDGRFDGNPAGIRYLGYTEIEGTAHYPAEVLIKEFHSPAAIAEVMARYS